MLVTDGGTGETVEDVLRALGAVLDERGARGVVLFEVPEGLVVRARVAAPADHAWDATWVSMEQAFGEKEILEHRMAAVGLRGSGHRAGSLERALRVLGRYIDHHDLHQVTLLERESPHGWLLWHRSQAVGRHLLVAFEQPEIERAADTARKARESVPVGRTRPRTELAASVA